ncbi:MAG: hypothetical protein F6K14_08485 [Symploca sp. SIO2C1]|nr:hypothetical protein [Symploca sp. SIO2C1]
MSERKQHGDLTIFKYLFNIIGAPIIVAISYSVLWQILGEFIDAIGQPYTMLLQIVLLAYALQFVLPLFAAVSGMFAEIPHLNSNESVVRVIASWFGLWVLGMLAMPLVGFFVYSLLRETVGLPPFIAGFLGLVSADVTYRFHNSFITGKKNYFQNLR